VINYTLVNLPPSVGGKPIEVRKVFIKAYEAAVAKGFSEEDAIFSANQNAKVKEKLLALNKSKELPYIKPKVPQHLSDAIKKAKESKQKGYEPVQMNTLYKGISSKAMDKALNGKGTLSPDSSRSLVSAKWDKQGRLELNFDDGNKIITDPAPIVGNVEQHIHVPNSSSEDNTMLSKRVDFINDNVIYRAEAPVGTSNSASLWRIRLITIAIDGDIVETWAGGTDEFNKVWDDRLTYTYS
jgi:hypothetical protein